LKKALFLYKGFTINQIKKGEAPMKFKISVPEAVELFNEIQKQPKQLFDMIRVEVKETVGQYLTSLMNTELTHFLGRSPYERVEGAQNHRNGSYNRKFTLKDLGEVKVNVPRDRQGNFKSQVIPASQQYEKELRQDLSMMFFNGYQHTNFVNVSQKADRSKYFPSGNQQCQ
jgi:putative transposase